MLYLGFKCHVQVVRVQFLIHIQAMKCFDELYHASGLIAREGRDFL